jgi:D-alanyl-D-alanine carboxypeptidase
MVKINPRPVLQIIILSALIICIAGCDNNSTFSGSKTSNDNQFLVDFDVMNSTVNGNMLLSEGETVETTFDIKKGDVDIIVVNENGTIAYQGNDVETCNFMIEIKEAGTYTFYITGFKAEGSVYFIKQ